MGLVGRKYTQVNSGYRYGFNGKEDDKDISEGGQDYGMRIYDSRLGRFLSTDPLTRSYPQLTPYQFASNRPIDGVDLDGLEFLDSKKFNHGAVWGILKFKRSTEYTVDDLQKKNKAVHAVVENHPDNKKPYGPDRPDDPSSPEKRDYYNDGSPARSKMAQELREGKMNTAADVAGGAVDLIKFGIRQVYNYSNKDDMEYAGASIMALAKANTLVNRAIDNPTFPKNLMPYSVLTDLTNYLTDGTKADAENPLSYYNTVIETWGDLLFNNKDAVGSFNFSPLKTVIKPLSIPSLSDTKVPLGAGKQLTGNPDPAVNNANKLIENQTLKRPPVFKSGE